MKKRRPCAWNQTRSPRNSTTPGNPRATAEPPNPRSKSFHDLKRRRLQRVAAKAQQPYSCTNGEDADLKKEIFGSLESLFDVKKPLNLQDSQLLWTQNCGEQGDTPDSSPKSRSPRSPSRLHRHLSDVQLEPHILVQPDSFTQLCCKDDSQNFERLEKIAEEALQQVYTDAGRQFFLDEMSEQNMGDNTEAPTTEGDNSELEDREEDKEKEEEEKEEEAGSEEDVWDVSADEGGDAEKKQEEEKKNARENNQNKEKGDDKTGAPPYTIPKGADGGVPLKTGKHRESTMSAIPLTDSAVMKEMKEADERCTAIAKEIEQQKRELAVLTNKKDLTQEDTLKIKEKQEIVMAKLGEFEQITRKLQRLLGLADPSSQTFSKMFGMIPYPHKQRYDGKLDDFNGSGADADSKEEKEKEKVEKKSEMFDIPQMEYPEDKLPRVIVCGYTEENIPKIVVGDSERKGKKKSFQNLTGKLNESLNMQEKLVMENAQLEGGKYKLEEALLEKENAVDSLQRKVCGLQAEMRIVVKENSELSRQLTCLNQRVNSSIPSCHYLPQPPAPPANSLQNDQYLCPPASPSSPQENDSCRCKCCQDETGDTFNTSVCGSPRLAGGACYGSLTRATGEEMCCRSPATAKASPSAPSRGTCPAELENKLAIYGNNTKQLEQQLGSMENEVRNMQMELANVQRERQQLEQQRKLLKCTGPCAPCACCPPAPPQQQVVPCGPSNGSGPTSGPSQTHSMPMPLVKMNQQQGPPSCTGSCTNAPMGVSTCPQQQLRDLREQYARLQDDYKSKLCEVSCLRAESEKVKQEARDAKEDKEKAENRLIDLEERMKLCEAEKNKLTGSKEQLVEQEQALLVAKQRFREAQDELEELRSLIQDQASQLEDYRNKYLQAQQQVEEQRRQLDLMEMDNARMNENVTLEIGRVKNQFQEKLAELAPLPDILKQTQVKLQEAQQMRLLAERNCEDLSRDHLGYKDKVQTLQNQMDILRNENQTLQDEKAQVTSRFDELEKRNSELRHENERMKNTTTRYEEHVAQMQKRIDEKMHEVTQLTALLEQVREDSARQVARTKERCETVRRSMQGQIGEMERQLAQCRATARAAQKDRDEIRQKMQGQINNLNEAFEQAQGRIRSLQGHVNYLKNSYSNIFGGGQGQGQGEAPPSTIQGEAPSQGQGYDSCDCNY